MLLGDFIKELKHNSTWININVENEYDYYSAFEGTLGVLKNNIHYQEKWSRCKIYAVEPMYGEDFKCEIKFTISEPIKKEDII